MTLVVVTKNKVNFPVLIEGDFNRDKALEIAFRQIYGRRQTDYSELANNTAIPDVITLQESAAKAIYNQGKY